MNDRIIIWIFYPLHHRGNACTGNMVFGIVLYIIIEKEEHVHCFWYCINGKKWKIDLSNNKNEEK